MNAEKIYFVEHFFYIGSKLCSLAFMWSISYHKMKTANNTSASVPDVCPMKLIIEHCPDEHYT